MVQAQTVALFPLLDLTVGPNGINSTLTELVRREIENKGFEIIGDQELMQFLVIHRIRSLGHLTSKEVALAGEELGADFVVQGAVCQFKYDPPTSVSLSLQLIRTSDNMLIWARTEGINYSELLTLLGLADPQNMTDMYSVFFSRLFNDMPTEFPPAQRRQDMLDIDTIALRPEYVLPGETVTCKIRFFDSYKKLTEPPVIFVQVDEKDYPLTFDEDGYYATASWPAQNAAGMYNVQLIEQWPDGSSKSGIIGTYFIDSQSPEVLIHLIGKEFDGLTAFSEKLGIIPELVDPEPISRWLIEVINEEGEVIVSQGGAEGMPRQLSWGGNGSDGSLILDGKYKIVFHVWDRVGLESSAETDVLFLRAPPDVNIDVKRKGNELLVNIDNLVSTPVSFWWMKFFDAQGRQVKLAQGDTLPATVTIEIPEEEDESGNTLEALLQVHDIMGNRAIRKVANLIESDSSGETEEESIEREWLEEF